MSSSSWADLDPVTYTGWECAVWGEDGVGTVAERGGVVAVLFGSSIITVTYRGSTSARACYDIPAAAAMLFH